MEEILVEGQDCFFDTSFSTDQLIRGSRIQIKVLPLALLSSFPCMIHSWTMGGIPISLILV